MQARGLAAGLVAWPAGQDALTDAVECVILAHWNPGVDPAAGIDDEDAAELYRAYRDLTGWTPTAAEKEAARPAGGAPASRRPPGGEAVTLRVSQPACVPVPRPSRQRKKHGCSETSPVTGEVTVRAVVPAALSGLIRSGH